MPETRKEETVFPSKIGDTPRVKEAHPAGPDTLWSRRNFFSMSGWLGLFVVSFGSIVSFIRFMFPRVLFEPSSLFKAGPPDDYSIGEVSEEYLEDQQVWIVRNESGFYALLAKCTHLGCTPRWLPAENKFKCPCHGSGFTKEGVNFEGPAPRALERLQITLSEDGLLLVDKGRTFLYEKGGWEDPYAFLRV